MEQLYTYAEAAKLLSASKATVQRLVKNGDLKIVRLTNKKQSKPRITESSLNNLIKGKE